jgi:hypothetical protein
MLDVGIHLIPPHIKAAYALLKIHLIYMHN